ncbi:MAG: beta-lactamase family protein [Opitutales bacterium]|nr:beta-lactamase family protein [Opitutales bacterium]
MKQIFTPAKLALLLSLMPVLELFALTDEEAGVLDAIGDTDVLFWEPEQRPIGLRNMHHLKPVRAIMAGEDGSALPEGSIALEDFSYPHDESLFTLDDYLERNAVTALLVWSDGELLTEVYRLGHSAETRWNGFSIAKSMLGLLLVRAVELEVLSSLDEPLINFLPELRDSAYAEARLIDLMRMSSGVAWNEDYVDPQSDVSRLAEFTAKGGMDGLIHHMRTLPQVAQPTELYNYNTGEIYLLGAALSAAAGKDLSTLLSEWLWQPLGMESDAWWMLNQPDGLETAGCCIAATPRDLLRLGRLVLDNGRAPDGKPILGIQSLDALFEPTEANSRYGALWFRDGDQAVFAAGIFGQLLYIDLQSDVVVVINSSWDGALPPERVAERNVFTQRLVEYIR